MDEKLGQPLQGWCIASNGKKGRGGEAKKKGEKKEERKKEGRKEQRKEQRKERRKKKKEEGKKTKRS